MKISNVDIKNALAETGKCQVWNLSKERVFLENLVQQRFNFFSVLFGVILVYGMTAHTATSALAIFLSGAIVCHLIAPGIARVNDKLIITSQILHGMDGHPIKVIGKLTSKYSATKSQMRMLGNIIPYVCVCVLHVLWIGILLYVIACSFGLAKNLVVFAIFFGIGYLDSHV